MKLIPTILAIGLLLPILSGCHDSQGNRVTFSDWWKGDDATADETQATSQDDKPHAEEEKAAEDPPAKPPADRPSPSDSGIQATSGDTSTNQPPVPPPHAIRSDALIVNDEAISVGDILEPIAPKLEQLSRELAPAAYYQRVAKLVRRQIIEAVAQHLIWRRAKRQITEDMEENLDRAVDKMEKERITREFHGRETMYQKYLAKHGKSRDDVRERLRQSLVIDSYLRDRLLPLIDRPSKRDLIDYYQTHLAEYSKTARREFFLIDIPIKAFMDMKMPRTPQTQAEAKNKARQAIEDAAEELANDTAFEEVAQQYSHGIHKADGGAWGYIAAPSEGKGSPLLGRWSKPSIVLFELKAGETSEIIESDDGFFLVKVGKVENNTVVPFRDAQPDISEILRQQRFAALRSQFLQKELDESTIGPLDDFADQVLQAAPIPRQ